MNVSTMMSDFDVQQAARAAGIDSESIVRASDQDLADAVFDACRFTGDLELAFDDADLERSLERSKRSSLEWSACMSALDSVSIGGVAGYVMGEHLSRPHKRARVSRS